MRSTLITLIVLTFAATWTYGQEAAPLQQAAVPGDQQDAAPNGGVYVHDSAIAMDKMALAERLENLKEWTKSAQVYQEVTEKYRDRVVYSHVDDQGVIDQYTSVLARVNLHLSSWPPEGLAVYNTQYELTAHNLIAQAKGDDLAPLHEAFIRYFVTESGKQAGFRLIDAYFEMGDFSAATWIGQQLLMHPTLGDDRPKVLFRVGLAAHLGGDQSAADAALKELKDKFPAAIGTIAGKDVRLADELQTRMASEQSTTVAAPDDSWPMPGGELSRDRIYSSAARPGARLYSVAIPQASWNLVPDPNQRRDLLAQDKDWRHNGLDLGIMPAVDRGELFFQDNAHVYALTLATGTPLPGWTATYPSQEGRYVLKDAWNLPTGHPCAVTLTNTAVLAVMNQPDFLAGMYHIGTPQEGMLVCLDRETGKENWIIKARDLPDEHLRTLVFDGVPLVVGQNVYIGARGGKGNGYEDYYVICFDLGSGVLRWSCYVAGGPSTTPAITMNMMDRSMNFDTWGYLSYASGRVFVCTNLGALAALDAYGGGVIWLDIYHQESDTVNLNQLPWAMGGGRWGFNPGMDPQAGEAPKPPVPWTAGAPIVHGGNVFVLPSDGKYVLIYNAGDGHLVMRLKKSDCCLSAIDQGSPDSDLTEPDAILGVLDDAVVNEDGVDRKEDLLLLSTPNRVAAIPWRTYDPDHPRAAWVNVLYHTHAPATTVRGRAFVTQDSIFIPTAWALCRVSVRNGSLIETYPGIDASWPADEGPGNVLVCADHVIIAGDTHVSVYSDLTLAKNKLDQDLNDSPNDPLTRLHYAQAMFLANQPRQAIEKFDQAISLLGDNGALRDQAFADALDFAVESVKAQSDGQQINDWFDRAARLARTPEQQVSYRLEKAGFERSETPPDLTQAMQLYEQVLSRPAWRIACATDESTANQDDTAPDTTQAGLLAQAAISAILHDPAGAAAAAQMQQSAQAAMTAAGNGASALLEVAQEYPESRYAQPALTAAASAFESTNQPRDAAFALRLLYSTIDDDNHKAQVLQEMAENYLSIPGQLEAAAGRLELAARLAPGNQLTHPMTLPGGKRLQNVSLPHASDSLNECLAPPPENLPRFNLPSRETKQNYFLQHNQSLDPFIPAAPGPSGVDVLVNVSPDHPRYDRVATWAKDTGVSIYALNTVQPIGSDASISDEPRGGAWIDNDLLLWSAGSLSRIDGPTVKARWTTHLDSMGELAVTAQASPPFKIGLIQPMNPMQRRRRNRMGLQVQAGGRVFQQRALPPAGEPPEAASEDESDIKEVETITTVQPVGDIAVLGTSKGRITAMNLADGSLRWQVRIATRAVDRLLVNGDFVVIRTSDQAQVCLIALDCRSGRLLARRAFMSDQTIAPINLALADDGTLAYTTTDQIVIHDLFDAQRDPRFERPKAQTESEPNQPMMFQGLNRPDQLVISSGQILALGDGGGFMRGYSLETFRLRSIEGHDDGTMEMATRGQSDTVLHVNGKYVYAWSPRSIVAFNLSHPETSWPPHELNNGSVNRLILGSDYLLLLDEPPRTGPRDGWAMLAFSRVSSGPTGAESGIWVYQREPLSDPHGIAAVEPIDGGLCYLAGDRMLHWLKGNNVNSH